MKRGRSAMGKKVLQLNVGDLAEAKTFEPGYRGAWFRCKIKNVIRRKGRITAYKVDYYDYEDSEENKELFEIPKESVNGQKPKRELMLRPQFPPTYNETDLPDLNTISQVIVAVPADAYAVGSLVDWYADGCFWSGTVTQVIHQDSVKITLLEPPRGEGSSYVVSPKDLRPSLDWSPESGWTVPKPSEWQSGHLFARVIQPMEQDVMDEETQHMNVTPRSSLEFNQSISSHTSISSLQLITRSLHSEDSLNPSEDISKKRRLRKHSLNTELDIGGSVIGKPSCSDSVSSTYVQEVQAEVPVATCAEELDHENKSAKKLQLNGRLSLNITSCDSIESSIIDLEELVNRVKWMKQILKFGISSNSCGPTWEFHEHSSPSTTPK